MSTFLDKFNNGEYISNKLYIEALNSQEVPVSFDLDKYNDEVLDRIYIKYKDYFDNMYKGVDDNIHLDEEQIKAILSEEDYSLIIAGAGTGKTTTMAAKVKYLVDIKGVDPSKILVMSYTKKATLELEKRIVNDFNIPAFVTTFHSLGYTYIKNIFINRKCLIVDINEKEKIFYDYFSNMFKDKYAIKEIMNLFSTIKLNRDWVFGNFFIENFEKYNTYEEFFKAYKEYKMNEAKNIGLDNVINSWVENRMKLDNPLTIKGDFVKSIGEAIIANYLFKHGIAYNYEEVYSEIMDDRSIYKPDFTLDLAGEKVYLEYFGLDDDKYNRIKDKKEKYHIANGNKYIFIDRLPLDRLETILDFKLREMGFVYNDKTNEEIYEQILNNTPLGQIYPFKNFMFKCIESIKSSVKRENYRNVVKEYLLSLEGTEKEEVDRQFKYINDFYLFYQDKLYGAENYQFDYSDLLYYAIKYIENVGINNNLNFEYIIIDEYQDISKDKYELARKTADRTNAKVFAVGDDWQSIYAFNGSRIDYIYNFSKYFEGAKEFKISKTYRNSQELIDYSGDFIMKNEHQIKKELISNKHLSNPIVFVFYDSTKGINMMSESKFNYKEYECLKKVIIKIYNENPEHNILILGRTNKIINDCFKSDSFIDDLGTKIKIVGYDDLELEGMTMHKSKGLTFDEVILIGLNDSFPSKEYNMFWLEGLFKTDILDEGIPFAEERRLFYVALTRTKNHVYLLVDKNVNKRSEFVDEIARIVKDKNEVLIN